MKQTTNYAITLVLWVVAIVLWATGIFPYLCWFLLALHFVELLVVGFRTGRKCGVSAGKSILMCMLYGYIWWLPLKKNLTSAKTEEKTL